MPDRTDGAGGAGVRDVDEPNHQLDTEFTYDDERRARVVAGSIGVEVGEMPDERSGAAVDRDGEAVTVSVAATDLIALRAGTNTWVRLVGVAEDVAAACDGVTTGDGDGADADTAGGRSRR